MHLLTCSPDAGDEGYNNEDIIVSRNEIIYWIHGSE